jgi:hypothetical protein
MHEMPRRGARADRLRNSADNGALTCMGAAARRNLAPAIDKFEEN